ncbi:MAG: hypothetical protein U0271_24620 [Polyangiaceae bacterium]
MATRTFQTGSEAHSDIAPAPESGIREVSRFVEAPPSSRGGRAAIKPRTAREGVASPAVRVPPQTAPKSVKPPLPPPRRSAPPPAPSVIMVPRVTPPPPPTTRRAAPKPEAPISQPILFRSLTTTAQDWPIASVPVQAREATPTFGSRPKGAPDPSRFSLPAFRPPELMQVEAVAKAESVDAALDAVIIDTAITSAPELTHLSANDVAEAAPAAASIAMSIAMPTVVMPAVASASLASVAPPSSVEISVADEAAVAAMRPRWVPLFAAGIAVGCAVGGVALKLLLGG